MKNLLKVTAFLLFTVLLLLSVSSCVYNPPEGYTKEHHTYEEILAFAKSLDPDAVVRESYTDTRIDDWNRDFREWDAVIHGINCHVSSVGARIWDSTGEFTKQYYVIDTDYDYLVLQKIVSEKQPDWEMEYTDISSIYNRNNLLSVKTPYEDNKELSEDKLEIAWENAREIYLEYSSHPVRKEAWFSVSIPIVVSNHDGENEYITYSCLVMKDFSAEGKTKFFQKYKEAWALLDSDLPVEQ